MVPQRSPARIVAMVAATYVAWIVSCVIGAGVLITWHSALLRLYVIMGFNKYGGAFFNDMVVLSLAMIWLALVVLAESWYRRTANEGTLGRAFFRATMAELALGLLGYVVGRL
jgi:hypothetical protein